jgi:hypothetical protein
LIDYYFNKTILLALFKIKDYNKYIQREETEKNLQLFKQIFIPFYYLIKYFNNLVIRNY